jgi:hypothetical protein
MVTDGKSLFLRGSEIESLSIFIAIIIGTGGLHSGHLINTIVGASFFLSMVFCYGNKSRNRVNVMSRILSLEMLFLADTTFGGPLSIAFSNWIGAAVIFGLSIVAFSAYKIRA